MKFLLAIIALCIISTSAMPIKEDFEYGDAFNMTESIDYHLQKYGALPQSTCNSAASTASHYASCGCPYVWGGTSCGCGGSGGMDCSGLVYTSYRAAGYSGIPRTSKDQSRSGSSCSSGCSAGNTGSCKTGDLFFYGDSGGINHVVMYIGGGKIAECPYTGVNCRVIKPYTKGYVTCRSMC